MIDMHFDTSKQDTAGPMVFVRYGDGNSDGITGSLVSSGKQVDLTDYTVAFEGVGPLGTKIVDTNVTLNDAKTGRFSYKFADGVAATVGKFKQAYFSFTKGNVRTSTGNIEIFVYEAVIDGVDPSDYIVPYNNLIEQLNAAYKAATTSVSENAKQQVDTLNMQVNELGKKIADYINENTIVFTNFQGEFDQLEKSLTAKVATLVGPQGEQGPKGDTGDVGPRGPEADLTDYAKTVEVENDIVKASIAGNAYADEKAQEMSDIISPLYKGLLHDGADLDSEKTAGTYFSIKGITNGPGFSNGDAFVTWTVSTVTAAEVTSFTQMAFTQTGDMAIRTFVSGAGWGPWIIAAGRPRKLTTTDDILGLGAGKYVLNGNMPLNSPSSSSLSFIAYGWMTVELLNPDDTAAARKIEVRDTNGNHYINIYAGYPPTWTGWKAY